MVSIPELWLPILVATVLVFVASNIVWMVLPHHKSDARRLPDEGEPWTPRRSRTSSPAVYRYPVGRLHGRDGSPPSSRSSRRGRVGLLTVMPNGPFDMGRSLGLLDRLPRRDLGDGRVRHGPVPRRRVHTSRCFRVVGTVAFIGYSAAQLPSAIWWAKPWSNVAARRSSTASSTPS